MLVEFLKAKEKVRNAVKYQRRKDKMKERYLNDVEYRERHLQHSKKQYENKNKKTYQYLVGFFEMKT